MYLNEENILLLCQFQNLLTLPTVHTHWLLTEYVLSGFDHHFTQSKVLSVNRADVNAVCQCEHQRYYTCYLSYMGSYSTETKSLTSV